jgi:ABC-type dipeptide/oligopeptide/nickel transport system ATPase component
LDVDLSVDYPNKRNALRNVSFVIQPGEVLGLVGESGSGKSTIALALLRLLDSKDGKITGRLLFRGHNLMEATEAEMRRIRGREIGLVMQSPLASLNPALRIGKQLAEAWRAHPDGSVCEQNDAVVGALQRVGLPCDVEFRRRYASQVSVGQAQRVLIAMATMHRPALLIADEPTSALDAVTQQVILRMIVDLNRTTGSSLLYISHDLQSVASVCNRVAILHRGEIVECGETHALLRCPQHPYTRELLEPSVWSGFSEAQPRCTLPAKANVRDENECGSGLSSPGQVAWRIKSSFPPPIGP